MGVSSTEPNSLLKLNSVTSSGFAYLGLNGALVDVADIQVEGDGTAAVEITGIVHDVTISKLNTQGTTYGLTAVGDTKGVVLENSGLDLHYKGVSVTNTLLTAPAVALLPAGVRYKIVSVGDT